MSQLNALPLLGILIFVIGSPVSAAEHPLDLKRAEQMALELAPWLAHHSANAQAAAERSVYQGRLPDPQLTLSAINVPTDTFSFKEDEMTMLGIGVRQAFPPGNTLQLRARRAEQDYTREQAQLELERRDLLRQVRTTWLDLYQQEQALRVLADSRRLQTRELQAAEARYRAAQETPRAVLVARAELARLDDREQSLRADGARARARLSRWIGDAAHAPLPPEPPTLPVPTAFDSTQHPEWLAARAERDGARTEIDMAREEYKPGVMLDFMYGVRQTRADMVTAQVSLDLPVFRHKRQDRRLAEKNALAAAADHGIEDKRRELEAMYQAAQATHASLTARVQLYRERLLPVVEKEAGVTVAGFARDQNEIRAAQMKALQARLELIQLRTELAKAQAELLYLAGEAQP